MTNRTKAPARRHWLRIFHAGILLAASCLYAAGTSAAMPDASPDIHPVGMSLAPALGQSSGLEEIQVDQRPGEPPAVANAAPHVTAVNGPPREDLTGSSLRLEHVLLSLGLLDLQRNGVQAHSPSWSSVLKFLYWFALLMLASLSLRDTLGLFRHLLSRPPALRPSMPHAPWPSMTVIFESHAADRIAGNLAALAQADYPRERLKILVLCPLDDPEISSVMEQARTNLPGQIFTMPVGYHGDVAGRCFSAGIRFGNGELLLVLSDTKPCDPGALKSCAERFFDPSLGALLGFLPGAAADDKALAPRMANLLRIASQTAGITSAPGMTPGTGLLALRRSAVRTAGMNPARATDCFALLRQLERFGSNHAVQEGVVAAGQAVHNWEGRSRWIRACASAFAATVPLNPLRSLMYARAVPVNFGLQGKLVLPALWCLVALGSIVLYCTGNAMAAAAGLAVCTATAYGVDGMPSTFNYTAVLFRVHGRRAEGSLVAWAPVMFCHDLIVGIRSALWSLCCRAVNRNVTHDVTTPTQPVEQSTLA